MKKLKIFITGASGFIGKNLLELWSHKYNILTPRSYEVNLLNSKMVTEFIKAEKFDVIIHCAKEDIVNISETTEHNILDHNLRMFFNLARCNTFYGKMLYFGSGAEYNREIIPNFVEEDCYCNELPSDAYGFSKYIMNEYSKQSDNIYNLCLFGVFGKYEAYQQRFISNNICRSLKGLPITLRQNKHFDYLYVKDLAKIVEWFLFNQPKFHQYNVCSGQSISLKDLADIVKKVVQNKETIQVAQPGLLKGYTGSNERLRMEFGEIYLTPLHESIAELYEYYLENINNIDVEEL